MAIRLLERPGLSVVLIDSAGAWGRGLAYSTTCDRHLLNVRSGRMSYRPEAPDHFVRWLKARGRPADPQGFARRSDYGAYVAEGLAEAEARAPLRLRRIKAEVTAVETGCDGVMITLKEGTRLPAEAAVLALGNPPPAALGLGLDALGDAYVADPWAPDALSGISQEGDVLLIGTGLTAIDVLLALEARGWRGRATALSRHGLLPRPHARAAEPVSDQPPPTGRLSERLNVVRRRARAGSWTTVMDELRPHGQTLWRQADTSERARFLRHLRPWWDVHRHRMAPEIAQAVDGWRADGRLEVAAGRLQAFTPEAGGVRVQWRPRGERGSGSLTVRHVVNCTGPQTHPARAHAPLLRRLTETGAVRPDGFGLGVDADEEGRVIRADGAAHPRLWILGPPAKAALWEVVAAPEIRVQAVEIADRLHAAFASRGVVDDLFLKHPREIGESYAAHMSTALTVGGQMIAAGVACVIHGVAPALFTKTASTTIFSLHARITSGRRGETTRQ